MRVRILFLLLFCLASPIAHAQTMQEKLKEIISQMERAALTGDEATFTRLREELDARDTPESYVALGKLFSNLPTKYVLRIKRYEDAATYYQRAIDRAAALNQDTKTLSEARINFARLILQNRLENRDYGRAVAMLDQAVQSGNANAAYILGRWLERGIGKAESDYKKAEYWYRYALRGEVGEAAIALVSLYKRGYVTPPNAASQRELAALGISLLRQRADRGDSSAVYRLGRVYALGQGVEVDRAEARKWYDLAATLGSVSALKELAALTSREDNDPVLAGKYMLKAAEAGSMNAAVELGRKLNGQQGYYLDVSDDVASLWVERAASLGNITAIGILTDRLLEQGKNAEAIAYLEQAARRGSVDSYLELYQIYKAGQGMPADVKKARKYFDSALQARELRVFEKERLGSMLLIPTEPVFDIKRGVALIEQAADAGSASAMASLADLYQKGDVIPVNNMKAFQWREKAAEAGDVASMLALSQMYEEGKFVPRDRKKANILLNKTLNSIAPDEPIAMLTIGQTYVDGKVVAADMDEAAKWFRRATEAGSIEGWVALGRLVKWNAVKDYDAPQAVEMFRKAASGGSQSAMVELGLLYSMGMLVPLDPTMAAEYFRMAADGGSLQGMQQLGLAYMGGLGVEKNETLGTQYLLQSANSGYAPAMLDLGNQAMMKGKTAEAVRWWKQAVAGNVPDAYYFLALAYREGNGVERNPELAATYLKKAAELDNYQAQLSLYNKEAGTY